MSEFAQIYLVWVHSECDLKTKQWKRTQVDQAKGLVYNVNAGHFN